ncbi:hypothetical protein EDB89DRAFT_2030393 [Lactarius sanguifluus]|nr:hypothetical protein EDB89DRAFT_2030393 [Lactarius sanguifluus]
MLINTGRPRVPAPRVVFLLRLRVLVTLRHASRDVLRRTRHSLAFRLFTANPTHAHPRDPSLEATLDNELWYSLLSPSPRSLSPDLEEPRVAGNLGLSCKYIGTRTGLVQHR